MKLSPVLLAVLLAPPSCTGHVLLFHPTHPTLDEREPNDSAASAAFFGGVVPGEDFAIVGHIDQLGPDVYDGFALRADAPCTIQFELVSHAAFTDLDVCVFDPDLGEFVVCSDGPFDPEKGQVTLLEVGKVVHLVVTSAAGDTHYTLDVATFAPPYGALAATAPVPAESGPERALKAERRRGYAAPSESEAEPPSPRRIRAQLLRIDLDTGERAQVEGFLEHAPD